MLDIAIIGGLVVDGTGNTPRQKDIGIKDGMIVEVAEDLSAKANVILDATHKMVTPGFIDVHSHCDLVPFMSCLLYTSDAADEEDSVDLGGRRIIKKKKKKKKK